MQDVVKVFIDIPQIAGYVAASEVPFVPQFQINTAMHFHVIKNETIINYDENWQYNAELGDTAGVIYASLYAMVMAVCQAQAFPTPTQKDIFCYVPVTLSQIFTDPPSIA